MIVTDIDGEAAIRTAAEIGAVMMRTAPLAPSLPSGAFALIAAQGRRAVCRSSPSAPSE